ncbi:unnamed protein product [Diatraea saccharalis]|uniref:PHD and RING finger domain-containing protein 1 n=1 Tax=Diatraea saccharalis TaxID=40085 RepID=A0A9N9R249_9NEOP|nr:unnamed protein product [Diatraea saccharalis]
MSDEGSEDSAPRPKRKIKRVVVMSSSSGSDSDENVAVAGTRRRRLVVSSDTGSESSGSSVIVAGTRRKRTLPKLRDSETESDTSGWATDHSEVSKPAPGSSKPPSGFASDSSEGNSDKCSICLMRFTEQEIGTPQSCEHIFCLDCIMEWAKNVNTCPVDRIRFESIIVKACAGGRVLRTEPVKVVQRRPSVDMLVVEDPTVCEICGNTDNEASMLLCDGCDLGFHMQCLTPPLNEIPVDQWFCPNCRNIIEDDLIHLTEVNDLFSSIVDLDMPHGPLQLPMREPRYIRRSSRSNRNEPSTSSGNRGSAAVDNAQSTSRGRQTTRSQNHTSATRRRTTGTQRRKYKRRRTKTLLIEYEVQENGKFPITKTVRRRIKKKRVKKRQPRTAARRAHVRASVRAKLATLKTDPRQESARAASAGDVVQDLSARRHRAGIPALSLFGNPHRLEYFSEEEVDGFEGAAVAVAARPRAAALRALRQARRKMISIPSPPHAAAAPDILSSILESQTLLHSKHSVVEISVDGNVNIKLQAPTRREPPRSPAAPRVDLTKGEDAARKAPSYPGQARGGGWGGGYRGTYHRDHATGGFHRASYGDPGAPPRPAYPANGARRDDDDHAGYGRRPFPGPDVPSDRRYMRPPERGAWGAGPPRPRLSEDPLDMRMAAAPPPRAEKPYRPLPEPPVFAFDKTSDLDRSEDERSDSGLVIDTEKYDPTEPTNDDDDESPSAGPPPPPPAGPPPPPPAPPAAAEVPADVLHSAVRQVLREHRGLLAPPPARSDDDSDGDCPNFSIYSATSVHIASEGGASVAEPPPPPAPDDLADLVQEDDDGPEPAPPAPARATGHPHPRTRQEEEYKERVSKRCPITTNPRNPIKIKLNAPSLIKRQVTLYDEEEEEPADDVDAASAGDRDRDPARGDGDAPKDDGSAAGPDGRPREATPVVDFESEKRKSPERDEDRAAVVPYSDDEKDAESAAASPLAASERDPPEDDESPEIALVESPRSETEDGPAAPPPAAGESDDEISDGEDPARRPRRASGDRTEEALEKMTESISETEDERSYTPCLDENKSKDTSLETEKEKGIEGLDTEMISEDEGNEMFSDDARASPAPALAPAPAPASAEDGEIAEKRDRDEGKKKKKKDSKREAKKDAKEKTKSKTKKTEIGFKKLSKIGKERNYRDKDRERRDSSDAAEKKRKRKEKRKDLERYDVRTVVTEKRRKTKDPFGRDVSPRRSRSPSPASPPLHRASASPRPRRSPSSRRRSPSPRRRSPSLRRPSPALRRPSPALRRRSPSLRRRSPSLRRRSPSLRRRSSSLRHRSPSPRRGSPVLRRSSPAVRRRSASPPARRRSSSSPPRARASLSPRSPSPRRRRRSPERRRRRSAERARKRRRSPERSPSPRAKSKTGKRRKRARSERPAEKRAEPRRKSPKRRRARRRSAARSAGGPAGGPPAPAWSPASVDSRLLSPRTPPPEPSPPPEEEGRRRREERPRHKRARSAAGPCKEVFTSGDNILVSVSFKEQERAGGSPGRRARRARRQERRRRRRLQRQEAEARPVAIIDLERSPFRELTPSPRNVIVLSDTEQGESIPGSYFSPGLVVKIITRPDRS